jgi:hypothetical protein
MKTHVLMFDVRFQSETDRPATRNEIDVIESIINTALGNVATGKLAYNATADYTKAGLINQPLHKIEDNKN